MIKKLLLASAATALVVGSAHAADLPRRAEPPPVFTPIPVFTWTGFYAGLHSAYTFTDRQRVTTIGNTAVTAGNVAAGRRVPAVLTTTDGIANIGGGFGYNYQFTPGSGFVIGFAADWTWTDLTKNRFVLGAPFPGTVAPNPASYRQSLDWLGTLNGKVGYAFDRFMVYGLGGFAYGNVFYDVNFYTPGNALQFAGRYDDLETGFSYGGGVEWAIPTDSFLNRFAIGSLLGIKSEAVTLKAEYLHYDLGSRNVLVAAIPNVGTGSYTARFRTEGSIVRAGLNYKFSAY
jgi:outer membrane immunogenic protein